MALTLAAITAKAGEGKALVLFPSGVFVVDPPVMDFELQRELWRDAGCFLIAGAELELVPNVWEVEQHPQDAEARRFERALGLPVTARVSRPPPHR